MTFEESIKKLEEMSEKIRDDETTLDDAVQYYEEGIKCYKVCEELLNNAKQKIEIYAKQ